MNIDNSTKWKVTIYILYIVYMTKQWLWLKPEVLWRLKNFRSPIKFSFTIYFRIVCIANLPLKKSYIMFIVSRIGSVWELSSSAEDVMFLFFVAITYFLIIYICSNETKVGLRWTHHYKILKHKINIIFWEFRDCTQHGLNNLQYRSYLKVPPKYNCRLS